MNKADAYAAEARRLARAFSDAMNRVEARLAEISTLPYGERRAALLVAARADTTAVREALEARRAHSATLRPIAPDEDAVVAQTVRAIERLVATLEDLHPHAQA